MAALCHIETDPIDIQLETATNTLEGVKGVSLKDFKFVLKGQNSERMTVYCFVQVNRHETKEVMLGQDVLRVAGCNISLFDNSLYLCPYALHTTRHLFHSSGR